MIPDPEACDVELPPNIEFTLYSTVIPTIEGNTIHTHTGLTITEGQVSNTVSLTDYSNTNVDNSI